MVPVVVRTMRVTIVTVRLVTGVLFWMAVIMMVLAVTVMKGTISHCHHGDGKLRGGNCGEDHSGDNDGADGDNDDGDRMMLMALVVTGEATVMVDMVVTMASVIAVPAVIYSVNSSRGHRGMSGSSMST